MGEGDIGSHILTLALDRDEVHLHCLILINVYTGCPCLTLS